MPATVTQAVPGVLENDEICPVGPTEPTMIRLSIGPETAVASETLERLESHSMFCVCETPSLPAAFTMTSWFLRLLSSEPDRMLIHSGESVQPGVPSEAF